MAGPLSVLCGQMLVVGISGTELSNEDRSFFTEGIRGGVVLFKRNVTAGLDAVTRLCEAVRDASNGQPDGPPPVVAIDQEGGRVVRLGPPVLPLPPMRRIGDLGDLDFARRLAEAQARELRALGFTLSFAPVADVHTRDENPIIGDRAFATTPADVARFGAAWAEGLALGGIASCAKHFPGHGDTDLDSHLALPRVARDKASIVATEIAPFRALAKHPALASMMTAHVVYDGLDPDRPATLSHAICTDLLRTELGFEGVLFSDDLEMKAIAMPVGEAAVLAVLAGCDALLVCSRAELAEEAHAALVREAGASPAFRERCERSVARLHAMRHKTPRVPLASSDTRDRLFAEHGAIRDELAARLAAQSPAVASSGGAS